MEFEVRNKKSNYELVQIDKNIRSIVNIIDGETVSAIFRTKDKEFKTQAYLRVTSDGQLSLRKYGSKLIQEYYKERNSKPIYCEIRKGNFELEFIEYYECLKNLIYKHRNLGYGKSTRLSEGFTESLCRYKLKLFTIKDRMYDAIDSDENLIEIKSTYDNNGSTTISTKAKFDYLLWMAFDIEKDEINIYKITYDTLKSELTNKSSKDRVSITLSKFITNIDKPYKKIKFDLESKIII